MNNKLYQAQYFQKNKARLNETHKKWQRENKEKVKIYQKKYRKEYPEHYLLSISKSKAKKKNLDFNITIEDIAIPTHCKYFNIPLISSDGKLSDNSPSLDRIDNTKGYVKGNVEVISYLANRVKNNLSQEQLITFAESILNDLLS